MNVLAIDQGTSGTKALVIGPDGAVLATAERPVQPVYGAGGLVEQDPDALLASVLAAGRQAVEQAGVPVAAIGLANQGETVLAWDLGTGAALTQAIVWQDSRATEICLRLAEHGPELSRLTGLSLDAYFVAPKLAWLRENLTREGVVTTTDTWITHHLTGAFVTDAATASRSLLLDLDTVAWSPRALELFGLAGEQLPRIVRCDEPVGETAAFGHAPAPLCGLAVDQQAALFGQGCHSEGDVKCTYGTGAFLLANTGATARRSASGLTASVAWQLEESQAGAAGNERGVTYCLDGQVYTVGSAVHWLAKIGVIGGAAELDAAGGTVCNAGGVVFVPALAGLAAPYWDATARGSLTGIGLDTEKGHIVRALLDGVACRVAELAEAVGADLRRPLTSLRVDGGLTRSALLMQTQADLLQVPVEVFESPDATAVGVGALARIGAGESGASVSAVPAAVYEPAIGADEARERLKRFQHVVQQRTRNGS